MDAWSTAISWAHLSCFLGRTGEQSCSVHFLWILAQPVTRALVVVLVVRGPSEVVEAQHRRMLPSVVSV